MKLMESLCKRLSILEQSSAMNIRFGKFDDHVTSIRALHHWQNIYDEMKPWHDRLSYATDQQLWQVDHPRHSTVFTRCCPPSKQSRKKLAMQALELKECWKAQMLSIHRQWQTMSDHCYEAEADLEDERLLQTWLLDLSMTKDCYSPM